VEDGEEEARPIKKKGRKATGFGRAQRIYGERERSKGRGAAYLGTGNSALFLEGGGISKKMVNLRRRRMHVCKFQSYRGNLCIKELREDVQGQ